MTPTRPTATSWPRVVAVLRDQYTVRRLRLACGLVMFTYLGFHFINHALGNISLQAMMWGTRIHEWVWHGPVGGTLLYGAFIAHFSLALWALYARRSFRMGWGEAARLALGFTIVPLLLHHYVAGRWVYSAFDIDRRYDGVLWVYFLAVPFNGERQVLVLIVAWLHGCLGIHYWLRHRPGYRRFLPGLLAFAVLWPVLALLGIAQGTREVAALAQNTAWRQAIIAQGRLGDPALREVIWQIEYVVYWAYAAIVAMVFAARAARWFLDRRRASVNISYPSGAVVRIPRGLAVLDASRRARIPHASICGGRGRCSTCRVRVLRGWERLPPPHPHEAAVLGRFNATHNVRLACQIRPQHDIAILPLLPADITPADRRRGSAGATDTERFVAIMFIDIRRSTALVEKRLPYDVIFLLNHFFEAVGGAVVAVGGAPNQFLGDGMMAIFGMDCDPREACRRAIAAAAPIHRRLAAMNRLLAHELPQPIEIGVGIHSGTVILGELGYRDRFLLTAIGDVVHVAARLQELTKEYGCQAVISKTTIDAAGLDLADCPVHDIQVRGRVGSLSVQVVNVVDRIAT